MQWKGRRESQNVEDRRGRGVPRGGMAVGGGVGGIGILVLLAYMLLGGDPGALLQSTGGGGAGGRVLEGRAPSAREDELARFASVVLADTEAVWHGLFEPRSQRYREPKMVFFTDAVQSACGSADAAVGPFYCSGDERIYIDLSFYEDLAKKLGADGDFAQAYVIAHEVGHHIQHLLGTSARVQREQQRLSRSEANELSVRLELQADFYAGVFAHHAKKFLDPGDIEEALGAAHAIGDDTLQRRGRGRVVPDSFTHGTSAQRVAWFRRGFQSGRIEDGDTFDERLFATVGR
jgi:predicted metalloprotease